MIYIKMAILFLTFLLSLLQSSFADNTKTAYPTIIFNRLTTIHGLSNNTVYDVLQDRLGFLWFATDDGLNRFDGYEFKIFRNVPGNENSILDNSIRAIAEDSDGNIWIGTNSGALHCYNPVADSFTHWMIRSDITKENTITSVYEDSRTSIWIGTYRSGLYRLDPSTGEINHWYTIPGDSTSLSSNYVTSIIEDYNGTIWIGTYNGLNKFHAESPHDLVEFTRYYNERNNPATISSNIVWNLSKSESNPDILWIGTADGLTNCDTKNNLFTQIKIPNPNNLQFGTSAGSVIEIVDNEIILWIDSFAGILRYTIHNGSFERFTSDIDNLNSLSSNHINGMIRDRSGVIWMVTENGVCFYSSKSSKFNNRLSEKYSFTDMKELRNQNITAITQTDDGRMWFGTDNSLLYTDRYNGELEIKRHSELDGIHIWSLIPGESDDLWVGTYGSGLYRVDLSTDVATFVQAYDASITIPSIEFNKYVYRDNAAAIWIGFWGYGLARLNPATGEYVSWHHDRKNPYSLSHNDVWVIYQDRKGRLWIGTKGGGLNLLNNADEKTFTRWYAGEPGYFSENGIDRSGFGNISSNNIFSICESLHTKVSSSPDTTVLWIGTSNGLNKMVIQDTAGDIDSLFNVSISYFTIEHGLPDNSVKIIIEDENGNLWLGTSSGISFFDTQTTSFINYTIADGIMGGDFNFSSAYKDERGILFMGSTTGLNYFDPKTIVRSAFVPPVFITDFQIFNTSVSVEDPVFGGRKSILYTEEIKLSHRQNVFSFQIAALDYNSPSSIEYAYMMEGFDNHWVYGGSRRFVTYTNLNPGHYTFKAKSTNSDGIWNEHVAAIRLIITPPWWQTGWAILVYVLVLIGGTWGIIRFQVNRAKLHAELRIQEFESHHLREVEKMKSRFFTNLSHEFRTPLTLIKGPLEQLMSGKIGGNTDEYYKMLLRNTEKLQRLIDQLLELSQLEAETIPLKTQEHNLVRLMRGFYDSFMPLAKQKSITFTFRVEADHMPARIDSDKLEKIINNLLSNAFKFTPEGESISVDISTENQNDTEIAVVSIRDTGIGIPEKFLQNIFDRFYRVDESSQRNYGGSGIGLALVKELVLLHNWDISVTSKEGEGSVFILKIPMAGDKNNVLPGESYEQYHSLASVRSNSTSYDPAHPARTRIGRADSSENLAPETKTKPKILIVEDSADVRFFLKESLVHEYDIVQAEKAEDGIALAKDTMPDLILSDIMMPGMDGLEFCSRIKNDWQTSHIPVILLTAKVLHDDIIQGLETGADDYITKPFQVEELYARIKNLILQRKHLHEKFRREITLHPDSVVSNSLDKEFMRKLMYIIDQNLRNEDFDSDVLAQQIFVSRSQLNRKLQAITGHRPGEFIRMYKLKRAAQLIMENKFSITQIAYEVGFNSPAQFSRAFRKHFSCLPSEFNNRTSK